MIGTKKKGEEDKGVAGRETKDYSEEVIGLVRQLLPSDISEEERAKKLSQVRKFMNRIGNSCGEKYYHVIEEVFIKKNKIFYPYSETPYHDVLEEAVDYLTDKRLLKNADFIKEMGPRFAENLFFAIARRGAVKALTDERFLNFLKEAGPEIGDAVVGAINASRRVDIFTDERFIEFVTPHLFFLKELGHDMAEDYFFDIAKIVSMFDEDFVFRAKDLLDFIVDTLNLGDTGGKVTRAYLRAIRIAEPEEVGELARRYSLIGLKSLERTGYYDALREMRHY